MNRKRLPRVIVSRADDSRAVLAEGAAAHQHTFTPVEIHAVEARPSDDTTERGAASAPMADIQSAPRSHDDVVRRTRAHRIVNRHACYSALGGIVPLPFVNFASVTTVIVRMVKVLSNHYRVPFERDRARAIVVGLAAGVMPSGAAAIASSTLFYAVPGSALLGVAVSSASAAACTRSIGRIFIEHFENGAKSIDLSENHSLEGG